MEFLQIDILISVDLVQKKSSHVSHKSGYSCFKNSIVNVTSGDKLNLDKTTTCLQGLRSVCKALTQNK